MSKINAIRLINLNYNRNTMHIDDEVFQFDGNDTLLSLRNGGGKSVIVQMLIAPFVHKFYRNTKERPFASFFTTSQPTLILVEWMLEENAGYVLTGMMVRKNQAVNETEEQNELEIINFISEYKESCKWDLHHLEVVITKGNTRELKSFHHCKQLFEKWKKHTEAEFYYYDMNQGLQARQYFTKLKEYQIDYQEWEGIIRKINESESGLSELFREAKDEKGLIEKWFLDTVEKKVNKETNKIKESESLVLKYVKQYKQNQSKIERKETILQFMEHAKGICEYAYKYRASYHDKLDYENKIANIIWKYEELKEVSEKEKNQMHDKIQNRKEKIAELEYKEISLHVYKKEDQKDGFLLEQRRIDKEKETTSQELKNWKRQLQLLECANYFEAYQEASLEQQRCENQLEFVQRKRKDLEPERNEIGYNLKCRYETKQSTLKIELKELEDALFKQDETKKYLYEQKKEKEIETEALVKKLGFLDSAISSYDEAEERYNRNFGDTLARNIVGEYEPALLEIKKSAYIETRERMKKEIKRNQHLRQEMEEKIRFTERKLEDRREDYLLCDQQIQQAKSNLEQYNKEIDIRKKYMQYVDLRDSELFETEKILGLYDKKVNELEDHKKMIQRNLDNVEMEYNQLKYGTFLDLPKEWIAAMEKLEIPIVYGIEWLKKRAATSDENEKMIKNNPFIPYSIILSKKELEKLEKADVKLYTTSPIPIVRRDELEAVTNDQEQSLYVTKKVSFYLWFDKTILYPEKLTQLLERKKSEIQKWKEQIQLRNEEQTMYIQQREEIRHQKIEKNAFEQEEERLQKCEKTRTLLDGQIDEIKNDKTEQKSTLSMIGNQITELQHKEYEIERKLEEFEVLCNKYKIYQNNLDLVNKTWKTIDDNKNTLEEQERQLEVLRNQTQSMIEEREVKKQQYHLVSEKVICYQSYQEGKIITRDLEDLEARYEAIISNISGDQRLLEQNLKDAKKRYQKCEKQLIDKADKYGLQQKDYEKVAYDTFKEEQYEKEEALSYEHLKKLEQHWYKVENEIVRLESEITAWMNRMEERCHKTELLNRSDIIEIDFQAEKKQQEERISIEEKKLNEAEKRIAYYSNSLHLFSDYSDFERKEEMVLEEDLSTLTEEEITKHNARVRRDYKAAINSMLQEQNKLRELLDVTARMEEFREDYYRKPIEKLILLLENADDIILQLETTLESYQNILQKLEVDIAFIEKEKDKVKELLLDYVLEIHIGLSKIDKDSTISVRGRSIKMLKLMLPIWEENLGSYQLHMKDFLEDLTKNALIAFDKNENVEELIGKRVTTRNLYDVIVGVNNIGIKLYKIEAQREYPITWSEVSRNSGAEGFLSAFVILSSLLSYMRKDDTDLFMDKKESKVLIMDNPFGRTSSEHILKPLMELAKKSNTQLICLSGLGGEAIYNSFDNIYVMNLVSSNFRKEVDYMRIERVKGEDQPAVTDHLISAHVLVQDEGTK